MSRPVKPPTVPLTVKISPELKKKIEDQADARVIGVSLLVTRAIEEFLYRLPPVNDILRSQREEAAD